MARTILRPVPEGLSGAALHDAAYALLGAYLENACGIPAPKIEKTALGAPRLAGGGPCISLAHTRGMVCCAVGEAPVGVDCERLDRFARRPAGRAVMARVCTARELEEIGKSEDGGRAFLERWVLKESVSKALGLGMTKGFRDYEIAFLGDGPFCAGHSLALRRFGGFLIGTAERARHKG